MREKVIRGFVSSVIVLLLLCFEYKLSFGIVHDFEAENTVYTIEDFYQINDYDVEGDRLVPTGGDPQLIMSFDGSVASEVSVFLSEAGGTDVKGQLYFYGKSGFSEKNSMPLNLDAGQTKFTWSMDKRNIGFLRIDWDGEVSLDHIEVTSQIAHISIAKAAVFSIVCLFVDLLIWLLLYKKIKQICQTAKAFLDKGDRALLAFGRRIRINISVFFAGFALIGGLVYSFIIPIGMVPDEPIHISLMCNALGVTGLSEQYYSLLDEGHILDRVRDAKLDVDRTLYREVSQIKFDKSQISFSFDIKKNVVGYIPCGIGFWLGYLLNLPIVW